MNSETMLLDFFEQVHLSERKLCRVYITNMRSKIGLFSDFLRRHATLADLNKANLNAWLVHLEKLDKTERTLKNYAGHILALWRLAWENELIETVPRGIRTYRIPSRMPEAWTINEVKQLLAACDSKELALRRMNRTKMQRSWGDWLGAYVRFMFDTALRRADTFKVRREHIGDDGSFIILQNKTGVEIMRKLSPDTMAAIDRLYLEGCTDPLFGFVNYQTARYVWQDMLRIAGFPITRRNGPQKLRRTSASYVELLAPGSAKYHLGHASDNLASKHYIDVRIARPNIPMPPNLGGLDDAE